MKLHVISRGHKTDFLALGLLRDGHLQTPRDLADFVLGEFAEGKIGARELLLREAEEEIGLVLGFVDGAEQFVAAADADCGGRARSGRWRCDRRRSAAR